MGYQPVTLERDSERSRIIPEIGFCDEKHKLQQRFVEAVKELSRLQRQLMQAVIEGDPDFDRFELLLHEASQKKDAAKYALFGHIDRHGC